MDELKPCPFCGEAPDSGWIESDTFTISCSNSKCHVFASIPASSEREAANFWNTRAGDTAQPTLRDLFAMSIVSGFISNHTFSTFDPSVSDEESKDFVNSIASDAYEVADAMLKVRKVKS